MTVQRFPALPSRINTGPTKFGNEWTGLFIRGDELSFLKARLLSCLMLTESEERIFHSLSAHTNLQKLNHAHNICILREMREFLTMIDACWEGT